MGHLFRHFARNAKAYFRRKITISAEQAKLADGILDLSKETIAVLSAPDMTHAMLKALGAVVDEVIGDEIAPSAAVAAIRKISQRLGTVAAKAKNIGPTALMVLAAVIQIFLDCKTLQVAQQQLEESRASSYEQEQILEAILSRLACTAFVLPNSEDKTGGFGATTTRPPGSKRPERAVPPMPRMRGGTNPRDTH